MEHLCGRGGEHPASLYANKSQLDMFVCVRVSVYVVHVATLGATCLHVDIETTNKQKTSTLDFLLLSTLVRGI